MSKYRLYQFDNAGGITAAEWIDAKSDEEGIQFVRSRRLSTRCELWNDDRFVAEIPAHAEDSPGGS